MTILSNSSNINHSAAIFSLCSKADEIMIASPFCYLNFADFANSIKNTSIKKVTFITTAKDEEIVGKIDSLLSFCKEMERIEVQWTLRVDNNLHGKVYIFKKGSHPFAGIITSANLTHNGMEKNHEWGVLMDDKPLLEKLEAQIVANAPNTLSTEQLDEIKDRVRTLYPVDVPKSKQAIAGIGDIVYACQFAKGTRVFIKPIGVSGEPPCKGDQSKEKFMHFSKKHPRSVRVGDILIAYAVGNRRIIGVFKVMSDPIKIDDNNARWPWYVEADCLTPKLSNEKWEQNCPFVTQVANDYVKNCDQPITHRKGKTLGALNFGSDKIWLDDNYGRHLLGMLLAKETETK